MKRLGSSDSLGALITICPSAAEEHNQVYPRDFQAMLEGLDEEGCVEESGHVPEKKRRLSVDQVKALEKNFEVENKLEPERKVKLAQELGLQPRQVAVWFQNRRARWKTKQLERDYGVLKSSYDALKSKYDVLQHDNDALHKEIRGLKLKFQDKIEVKDETMLLSETQTETESDHQGKVMVDHSDKQEKSPVLDEQDDNGDAVELNFESLNSSNGEMGESALLDFKDGSSDSDTSAILNEEMNMNSSSPNGAMSSSSGLGILQSPHQFLISHGGGAGSSLCSSSAMSTTTGFQFADTKESILGEAHKASYQPQFVKIEEHNFFGGDETCSTFFTDEQPPTLSHWYSEEWN